MTSVRPPAVAGLFYPAEARDLDRTVRDYLAAAGSSGPAPKALIAPHAGSSGPAPKALIAPHAGYVYSGAVAASVYARLREVRAEIDRVVLLGPAHRHAFRGLALCDADSFATPLGTVPVDREAAARIATLPQIVRLDAAHRDEHSLEVHLPFLQRALDDFAIVPLVVGDATPEQVAEVIECLWGGRETLIVVSSDLSHYLDYDSARRLDAMTSRAIEALRPEDLAPQQACGRLPIQGLLRVARTRGLSATTVDLRNSGDTAGPRDEVVGYGAWLFA
ncbi:MAG: AmmeMemoRadiSam system protein B [Alphaproteobacteria bacterium]